MTTILFDTVLCAMIPVVISILAVGFMIDDKISRSTDSLLEAITNTKSGKEA